MIYIASDHGGFRLKEKLEARLSKDGIVFEDLGPKALDPDDDYPDFAKLVGQAVARNPSHIGILLCRSGQGMCIAANKIKGVRAVSAWNNKLARTTRNDDFGNVLCIASDHLRPAEAVRIAEIFIHTRFSEAVRHKRRVTKIKKLETAKQ